MVKTRAQNEAEVEKSEETESTRMLNKILAEIVSMKRDIDQLKEKTTLTMCLVSRPNCFWYDGMWYNA